MLKMWGRPSNIPLYYLRILFVLHSLFFFLLGTIIYPLTISVVRITITDFY